MSRLGQIRQSFRSHNDRALKVYGLVPGFTFEEFRAWFAANAGKACTCGAEARSIDHVIPLARGGAHALSNFQFLCRPCNSRKGHWLDGEVRVYPWQKPGWVPYFGPKRKRRSTGPTTQEIIDAAPPQVHGRGLDPNEAYVLLDDGRVYYRFQVERV